MKLPWEDTQMNLPKHLTTCTVVVDPTAYANKLLLPMDAGLGGLRGGGGLPRNTQ